MGPARLGSREVGLVEGGPAGCVLVLGSDVLQAYALSVDFVRGEVAFGEARDAASYRAAQAPGDVLLELTREPRGDWPLLPVRRRFWERVLRAVDKAGTGAQLRTQLWIVYDAVEKTADLPLGNVVDAAFLYDHIKSRSSRR